ncbi:MAG: arginine--tRNA ligase [Lachnospiraceae bacterium]|nr:arginine--tRNA ligase [Lachnospiraceae bacterium]
MKKITEVIKVKVMEAFKKCNYDEKYGVVSISNRPDLCQYQCNGALMAAKEYKKAPFMIANDVLEVLKDEEMLEDVAVVNPGFINFNISKDFLAGYVEDMSKDEKFGYVNDGETSKVVIDFGGANVAKPLHVGHLRSAIIGESIKRINRFVGNDVTGDAHLGDWGLQMGLIITELKKRQPDLIYFDDSYEGEYPEEAPFTMSDLEEIYPCANAKSKEDEAYKEEAQNATYLLQNKKRGYYALWKHIINVSINDLKRIYTSLSVDFDLWGKESDAQEYIPDMVEKMKADGHAHLDEGALVVDVKEETDTKEMPPCMILKSDGATLYNTTDLATIVERVKLFNPDTIKYVVDKRQSLYFEQVFRCAKKTEIIKKDAKLDFLGFGTMNGKDGKPFKTRDGGVMRLEYLIKEINDGVYNRIMENRDMEESEARQIASKVGLAALKYGDLSNQASKDYIFDVERFTSFEGNTGPYILYTIVRIKSILAKNLKENGELQADVVISAASTKSEEDLMLALTKFIDTIENAYRDDAPHRICQFVYELSEAFNKFYHENKILANDDTKQRNSWIKLITLVADVLNTSIDLLGFEAPERM